MILPKEHETLTDEQLVAELVEEGAYDQETAEAVVFLLRHPQPGDLPLD